MYINPRVAECVQNNVMLIPKMVTLFNFDSI